MYFKIKIAFGDGTYIDSKVPTIYCVIRIYLGKNFSPFTNLSFLLRVILMQYLNQEFVIH